MSAMRTPMCFVCTIVERGSAQKIARAYEKRGVGMSYRLSGEGTASSDLLDILGIGTSERDVLLSPAKREAAEALVEMIHQEGISGVRAKGIMCVIPVTAASAKNTLASLSLSSSSNRTGVSNLAKAIDVFVTPGAPFIE